MNIHTHTCRVFSFKNEQRGKITFEGNLLFTHFGEIGTPQEAPPAPDEYLGINTIALDVRPVDGSSLKTR